MPERGVRTTPLPTTEVATSSPRLQDSAVAIGLENGGVCRAAWLAMKAVLAVIRNATMALSFAWLAAFILSRGNVFAGPPGSQSYGEFLSATLIWSDIFGSTGILLSRSTSLIMVLRKTFWVRPITVTTEYVLGQVTASYLPSQFESLRVQMYLGLLISQANTACIFAVARRIYKLETVEGQLDFLKRQQESAITHSSSHARSTQVSPISIASYSIEAQTNRPQPNLSAFALNVPTLASIMVPFLYVHIVSQFLWEIAQSHFALFSVLSLCAKVLMQEISKVYILKRKRVNVKTMATLVALPTIVVDTQTRLALMLQQTTSSALWGLVVMGGVEILFRAAKVAMMHAHVSRRYRRVSVRLLLQQAMIQETRRAISNEFDTWLERVKRYNMTEISADMYAEYLAIGCSYAIVFFFCGHPHFAFAPIDSSSPELSSNQQVRVLLNRSQGMIVVIQIVVEVVVDWISCVVEIFRGHLDFTHLERERNFFVLFFITVAVFNIMVAGGLYLRRS